MLLVKDVETLYCKMWLIHMTNFEDKTPVNIEKLEKATQGTKDHVFMLMMKRLHGREKHTMKGWMALLGTKKSMSVK